MILPVLLSAWLLAGGGSAVLPGQSGVSVPASTTGVATWYDDGPGSYGAVNSWRFGDTPYRVKVCTSEACVTVTVRDVCACPGGRIIDLSPTAFSRLAPLSRGIVRVTMTDLRDATPPATDKER